MEKISKTGGFVGRLEPRDHVTSALQHLHWLPVQQRIIYKLCLLIHLVITGRRAPSYLMEFVTATAALSSGSRLRSASSCYEQPCTRRKFGNGLSHSPDRTTGTPSPLHCRNSLKPWLDVQFIACNKLHAIIACNKLHM